LRGSLITTGAANLADNFIDMPAIVMTWHHCHMA
jgi:hypothetical protein